MLSKNNVEKIQSIAESRFHYMTYEQVARETAIDLTTLLKTVLTLPHRNIRDISDDTYKQYRKDLVSALVSIETLATAMATSDMEITDELNNRWKED